MDLFRLARGSSARRTAETDGADLESQQQQQPQPQQEPSAPHRSPLVGILRHFSNAPTPTTPPPPSSRTRQQSPDSVRSSEYEDAGEQIASPKTPVYSLNMPSLPSTHLDMPDLSRTWTQDFTAPPSRPPTAASGNSRHRSSSRTRSRSRDGSQTAGPGVGEPVPAMPAMPRIPVHLAGEQGERQHGHGHARTHSGHSHSHSHGHGNSHTSRRRDGHRRRFRGADPAELHLVDLAEDGRQRHRTHGRHGRSRRHATGDNEDGAGTTGGSSGRSKQAKSFMFCFPPVRSRQMRSHILRVFVSACIVALMITIYLALSLTHNISNNEFAVLLILMVLFTTVFMSHSLVRICMMVVRPPTAEEEERHRRRHHRRGPGDVFDSGGETVFAPGGYAIPRQPIRVVLARDEEAAGMESVAAKIQPPAYGLWRESIVRLSRFCFVLFSLTLSVSIRTASTGSATTCRLWKSIRPWPIPGDRLPGRAATRGRRRTCRKTA